MSALIARLAVLSFVPILYAPASGSNGNQASARADETRLAAVFAEWDEGRSPGCACGVVKDGELAFAGGFGLADLEQDIELEPTTRFYVGSLAKQFTAAVVLLLAEDGLIDLDADVRKVVPELLDLGVPITARQLLTHSSGVRDYLQLMWLGGVNTAEMSIADARRAIFRQRGLNFAPGERTGYSNSGYALLAIVVERLAGEPLGEVARRRLFAPLEMTSTTFVTDRSGLSLSVPGHRRLSGGEFEVYQPDLIVPGVGGLVTTVSDLARWASNLQQPGVGGEQLVEGLTRRGRQNDGSLSQEAAGLQVRERFGREVIEHGGSNRGFSAHFAWVRGDRLAAITLCNVRQANATALNLEIVAQLLEAPPPSRTNPSLSDGQLADLEPFAGVYESRDAPGAMELEIDAPYAIVTIYGDHPGGSTAGSNLLDPGDDGGAFAVHGVPVATSLAFRGQPDGRSAILRVGATPPVAYRPVDPRAFADRDAMTGRYRSDELGAYYELSLQDGELVVRVIPDDRIPVDRGVLGRLTDLFFVLGQDPLVNFRVLRRFEGRVEVIEVNEPRVRGVQLTRVTR